MIVTVTCNPAVDLTYRVPRLTPGAVHRVARVEERAGGKGVNVARVLAQLGESVAEGTIGRWLKQPGDTVAKYEPLLEVITDKVNAEVPSPFAGVLKEILAQEGDTVVEVSTDLALDGMRWRHPVRFVRVRDDLLAGDLGDARPSDRPGYSSE